MSPLRCGKSAAEFRLSTWSESPVGTVRYWQSCLSQIANQAACLEAVQDAEARRGSGFQFDFVVRIRPDVKIMGPWQDHTQWPTDVSTDYSDYVSVYPRAVADSLRMNWDDWVACRTPLATCGDRTIESLLLRRNTSVAGDSRRRKKLTAKELRALFGQHDPHRPPVGLVRPAVARGASGRRGRAKSKSREARGRSWK